ncbi:ATP-binding cassette domain-containing protein [Corynebacterium cystitidis]|uniref:ABC-2 type transport system ATP-binding protein n=1 Tax=Corynebacterium cystitidis DSM 20524 TaxID=1121357 RepID=A0A1H9UZU9_9CORY|nr:ABC transporter ATP-binding protein [Corynebacterium cystitidis]WJY83611.1 ABC transporter ATP-binding protein YtrB [Corynebacterium cystitidis DSM 20524]SES14942.1 ABC-2 type transport system ATP-binding protein [Corynebacterium cystitidis DSM 20524]SNV91748.1 ABC transporter ATP-binding protein [Corynebacterium cystitidis]
MIIHAHNLAKHFGDNSVLRGLDLKIPHGGIHGLLGRNGVGKSTLLGLIAGQIKPSSGELTVFGETPFDRASVMDRVVYAGIDVPYPGFWTISDLLSAAGSRYPRWGRAYANTLLTEFGFSNRLSTQYKDLSRGERSMIGIVIGLAAGSELTLLDEPYVGLDVHNRQVFYHHLLEAAATGDRTFLLATHHIEESSKVLDSFAILGRTGAIDQHYQVDNLADGYVIATAPNLPELPGMLARRKESGTTRALVPREIAFGLAPSVRTQIAELDDVIVALLEES